MSTNQGSMIHKAGAGPEPIPHKELDVDNLRDGITFLVSPPAKLAAKRMADQIRSEARFSPIFLDLPNSTDMRRTESGGVWTAFTDICLF